MATLAQHQGIPKPYHDVLHPTSPAPLPQQAIPVYLPAAHAEIHSLFDFLLTWFLVSQCFW